MRNEGFIGSHTADCLLAAGYRVSRARLVDPASRHSRRAVGVRDCASTFPRTCKGKVQLWEGIEKRPGQVRRVWSSCHRAPVGDFVHLTDVICETFGVAPNVQLTARFRIGDNLGCYANVDRTSRLIGSRFASSQPSSERRGALVQEIRRVRVAARQQTTFITRPGGTAHTEGRWNQSTSQRRARARRWHSTHWSALRWDERGPLAHSTHDVRTRHRACSQIEGARSWSCDHPPAGSAARIVAMNRAPVDRTTALDFWHRSVSVTQLKAMPFRGSRGVRVSSTQASVRDEVGGKKVRRFPLRCSSWSGIRLASLL